MLKITKKIGKFYFSTQGSFFNICLLIHGERKRLCVSRDMTVIQCLNLAPFAFVLFASSLYHFLWHQVIGKASRHGPLCSVFFSLIGESEKMTLVVMKFVILFE